jgi:flagellar assembly factor FliW
MRRVLVRSERLGDLEVADDKVLTFPGGLVGLPGDTRFVMIAIDDGEAYRWLQSVDDPGLSFLTVIPWVFFPDYEPDVDDVTQQELGLKEAEDAIVLCTVTVREGEPTSVTANLLGPLIVNAVSRVGRQVVLADSSYPTRAPLVGS